MDSYALLALVRWQRTRRGYDDDARLVRAGFKLMQPDENGHFGPQSALGRAEQAFNLPWQRMASEVLQFAVFLVTKARKDEELRPKQMSQGLHLLQLALNAFAVNGDQQLATLPLNSCNLLLVALSETLEKVHEDEDTLQTLEDVKSIFLYLFGLPSERLTTTTANFQMYRPPTNVYAIFLKRALAAVFKSLKTPQVEEKNGREGLYVDVVHASLFVFQELQKTQTNKKKVFLAIAKTSLRDFVMYRYELVTLQGQGVTGVGEIIALLDRVVEDALFDEEHIYQFGGAMVYSAVWQKSEASGTDEPAEGESKPKKRRKGGKGAAPGLVSYQKNLFDEFLNFLLDAEVSPELKASIGGFFDVLVCSFAKRIRAAAHSKIEDTKTDLKTSRKRAAIVIATTSTVFSPFKFWSEMSAVAFLAFQKSQDSTFLEVLVTLYNSLFRALSEYDVYRVTEDTEEREQFQMMEKVLSSFLKILQLEQIGRANARQAAQQCQIISSAVKCSPNLVNDCLVQIFDLLGSQQQHSQNDGDDSVIAAASSTVVDLVRAYDSMRLLDGFLRAAFGAKQAVEGLYKLFALPLCEGALRKAFMTLPPGQMDVLWNLFVEQIAVYSTGGENDANGAALVRLLFQTFVQEVHVVPQNRSKVVSLVSRTHERLLTPLAERLARNSNPYSSYERELLCVFGELLMFDTVLSAAVREQTFDVMFSKLKGNLFGSVMEKLLFMKNACLKAKKKAHKKKDGETKNRVVTDHGLGASGIIKVCVYWLRKTGNNMDLADDDSSRTIEASGTERERVTQLVLTYIVQWKCWETVGFHLPELLADANGEDCVRFFRDILGAFIDESVSGDFDDAARRIICDAEFYEITSLREVAPAALVAMVTEYMDEAQNKSPQCLVKVTCFFRFLLDLPANYLKPEDCGDLLSIALSLYKTIKTSLDNATEKNDACVHLLAWTQLRFSDIAVKVQTIKKEHSQSDKRLRDGVRFIIAQLVTDSAVGVALVAKVLRHYLDIGDDAFIKELLCNVVNTKKQTPTQVLERATIVVEALALSVKKTSSEEENFINNVVDMMSRENMCKAANNSLSLKILNALLKYQAMLHIHAQRIKQPMKTESSRLMNLLVERVGSALAVSMKLLVESSDTTDTELRQAAWIFFENFCREYGAFRSFVTPLETYGCLLAVAFSLSSNGTSAESSEKITVKALQALIANANKEEFRLILATILKELIASESPRKLSALRALCLVLSGERKLTSLRRQVLNERKEMILEALLQNFALQSLHAGVAQDGGDGSDLVVWNLKAFVQVFCKAELFTWKTHELQHVFTGFQPLVTAVSCWQAGIQVYSSEQMHQLWTLSYTLLLRIIRNHFASLVNGIPHLVQAANGLLQLVVLVSEDANNAQHCLEWSSNLARLYGYMKEHDVQLRKHVVYLLMAFLLGVTRDKLPVKYQQKLRPGVFALLDVCSPYEKEQLYAALDSTGKSLLKTLDTNYKLTYRFVGKV